MAEVTKEVAAERAENAAASRGTAVVGVAVVAKAADTANRALVQAAVQAVREDESATSAGVPAETEVDGRRADRALPKAEYPSKQRPRMSNFSPCKSC